MPAPASTLLFSCFRKILTNRCSPGSNNSNPSDSLPVFKATHTTTHARHTALMASMRTLVTSDNLAIPRKESSLN